MPPFKPFKSKVQEALMNSSGRPPGISDEDLQGMNTASKGLSLPARVKNKKKRRPKVQVNMKHFSAPPAQSGMPMNPMPGAMGS